MRGATWALRSFQLEPLHESTAPAAGRFQDIPVRALGHNTSYRHQLALSLDEWRGRMDEATGVDVYGHNGVAVGDYNGDGLEDLYVCQPSGLPTRLYRANGDGTFDDVSSAAGVDILDASTMALFADTDNDGNQDLLVIAGAHLLLFVNDGKGKFTPHPNPGFRPAGATLTSAAMADYDRDGDLDLYVCAYDFWSPGADYDTPIPRLSRTRRRALRLAPKDSNGYLNLAMLYSRQRKTPEARRLLQQLLTLHPGLPRAIAMLESLR